MQLPAPLDGLSAAEQELLVAALERVDAKAGARLFEAGEPGDGCYILAQGDIRLELARQEHTDTERVLAHVAPGAMLGELSLLDGQPRSASAFAETDVVAYRLSAAGLAGLSRSHPQIAVSLLQTLGRHASQRLRSANTRLSEYIAASAPDPEIDAMVANGNAALRELEQWPEERIDALLLAVAQAVSENAAMLAEATVKETRIGNIADKTHKNTVASLGVYHSVAGQVGAGVVAHHAERGVTEIACPAGVVFALVPVTNPVATAVFKTLISIKARCPVILSFHRACLNTGNIACELMERVLTANGAPAHTLQWVRQRNDRAKTAKFMSHPGVALVLATGGSGMVEAAYSSGKPALGVGPGNAPAYVAADADLDAAARAVILSKSYDNGLICGAEHNLVVDDSVRDAFAAALQRHGAAVLDASETARFVAAGIEPDGRSLNPKMIGQQADRVAAVLGLKRDYPIKLIVVPASVDAVKQGSVLAGEKLTPMLSLFTVRGEDEALALCLALLRFQGTGHTAVIHTKSNDLARRFGLAMPASRVLHNSPGSQGVFGITTGLVPSCMLGCGTFGGNSTTDNVTFRHLQNIKRLAALIETPMSRAAGINL